MCPLSDESIKHLTKGHWPNLKKLSIRKKIFHLGVTKVSTRCLTHLGKANWCLVELRTTFLGFLSIDYFSAVVRPATA